MPPLQGEYFPCFQKCRLDLIQLHSSTIKSIVITSSVVAIFGDSPNGVLDETKWNEDSTKAVESWKPGDEISPNVLYRASKVLAEKGQSIYMHIHVVINSSSRIIQLFGVSMRRIRVKLDGH